jgi:hypothetical protein
MNTAGKKSCGKQWKCRILGATRLHSTMQRAAAFNENFVHDLNLKLRAQGSRRKAQGLELLHLSQYLFLKPCTLYLYAPGL